MQKRHSNRQQYFNELAYTSEKYFLPYITDFVDISSPISILEVGCGDGGNLLPLARRGHQVVGVDISQTRINDAISFFKQENADGVFICHDILKLDRYRGHFDLVICHDVIEHIDNKDEMIRRLQYFMKPGAILFLAFPAWQMPFGGHQQICHNRWLSMLPFFHLLPGRLYKSILRLGGEQSDCINELMSIKSTKITIERFESLIAKTPDLQIVDRRLYLVNPHYEVKFGLKPRSLCRALANIPYLRNFFSTSCFYVLRNGHTQTR